MNVLLSMARRRVEVCRKYVTQIASTLIGKIWRLEAYDLARIRARILSCFRHVINTVLSQIGQVRDRQDIVARIDMQHFAGDTGRQIAQQIEPGAYAPRPRRLAQSADTS